MTRRAGAPIVVGLVGLVGLVSGCPEHGSTPPGGTNDGGFGRPDAPVGGCRVDKLAFTQATGCGNDGSVEFCIPDNQPALETRLAAIAPTITCAPGGGRAMCLATPGRLLCSFPTRFPEECEAPQGAMTKATFADICSIAELPEVTKIVPTIFE